jgi:hypothetical protein
MYHTPQLREDSYILTDWRFDRRVWAKKLVTKDCSSWGGLNDKVAMLDARFGYKFFAGPLLTWHFNFTKLLEREDIHNPETYLAKCMRLLHVPFTMVTAELLPAITSRLADDGSACIPLSDRKLGRGALCVPRVCAIRAEVFRRRCPLTQHTLESHTTLEGMRSALLSHCVRNQDSVPALLRLHRSHYPKPLLTGTSRSEGKTHVRPTKTRRHEHHWHHEHH